MRDIGAGEALTISYAAGFSSVLSRRQYLLENYRFFCRCEVCRVVDATKKEDEKQQHEECVKEEEAKKTKKTVVNLKQCESCFAEGYLRPVLVRNDKKADKEEEELNSTVVVAGLECESCLRYYPNSQ